MKNQLSNIGLEVFCYRRRAGGLLSWTGETSGPLFFAEKGGYRLRKERAAQKEVLDWESPLRQP